jgi:membrane protein required for colicin V production
MNWVDVVIVGIIFLSALVGMARGLVREAMSLVVWLSAIGVGYLLHKGLAAALTPYITQPTVRLAVAFLGIVVLVLIVGAILSVLLNALIEKTGLTWIDRLLGVVFGAVRGFILVTMAVFLAALTPVVDESWWKESGAIPVCQQTADWLLGLVPSVIQDQFKKV